MRCINVMSGELPKDVFSIILAVILSGGLVATIVEGVRNLLFSYLYSRIQKEK
jgi:hypothetical protein